MDRFKGCFESDVYFCFAGLKSNMDRFKDIDKLFCQYDNKCLKSNMDRFKVEYIFF